MTPERYQRLVVLFEGACERQGAARAAFLDESCKGDEALRREVEELLAADQESRGLLDQSLTAAPSTATRIGPYRIEQKLGEGGMGTVFRALDTKLNRPVAIKFLSDDLANAAARRRFQREAQMASSLNHPHILTVYDAGESEGRQYIVTEYIDGGTLRDWAKVEKRVWRPIIELLTGVADGLATAHEAGILHRDIKPDNILITRSGYAKLADFGLAKLSETPSVGDATRTLTEGKTKPGVVLGTIAYMSPEQAAGKPLDARSDVFSFAIVLYEMLCGRKPFAGATDLELLQTIIHGAHQPLSENVPLALRLVVEKALEKDAADRYQSMREMVVDLRRIARQSGETAAPPRPDRRMTWAASLALLALFFAAGSLWYFSRATQPTGPVRLEYTQLTNFADSAVSPALSPDGRMLAFIRGPDTFWGPGEVYVKLLPGGDPVPITHDGLNKMSPVFDPAGTRIAYSVLPPDAQGRGETWTVPLLGGEPSRLLAKAEALSFVMNPSGLPRVMFSEYGEGAHLSIITAAQNRSEARIVYSPPATQGMAHRSYLSPDQKSVLVVEMVDGAWMPCRLVAFDGSSPVRVVGPSPGQCTSAAWSPDSKWMFFSAKTGSAYHIWRQKFPDGPPEQLTSGPSEEEGISVAPDGRSLVTSVGSQQSTLWTHDARGERQITSQGYASLPRLSPDGTKLYYLLRSSGNRRFVSGELWTANLETGKQERLLPDFVLEHYSISTDGKQIVFAAVEESGNSPLWLAALDGSMPPRSLSSINATRAFFGVNDEVYFMGGEDAIKKFVYRVKTDGSGLQKALPVPIGYFYDVSPDGKFLAVLVGLGIQAFPADGGPPTLVCTACGAAGGPNRGITPPGMSWSPDGKWMYLNIRREGKICAVPLQHGRNLPLLPASGIRSLADATALPGGQVIDQPLAFVGANPSVYAFPRVSAQRNIYRVSIH